MLQIIIFMLVLALAYVIKAGSIMLTHEELAADSAAFAWVHAEEGDNGSNTAWVYDEAEAKAEPEARVARPMRRQVA